MIKNATRIGYQTSAGFDEKINTYSLVMGFHGSRFVSIWEYNKKGIRIWSDNRVANSRITWYGITEK
jgi:hypothetical protein